MNDQPTTPAAVEVIRKLVRPIIGIENRTAQEAFDIMADRVRSHFAGTGVAAIRALPLPAPSPAQQQTTAWRFFKLPLSLHEPEGNGAVYIRDADGNSVAMLMWPGHSPDEETEATEETYRLGRLMAAAPAVTPAAAGERERIAGMIALAGLGTNTGEPRLPHGDWKPGEFATRILTLIPARAEKQCFDLADAILATRPTGDALRFKRGDRVEKISGSAWHGRVVGEYSTKKTPEGYAVESERESGSVQIYPAKALRIVCETSDTLQAENVRLREALEPFADLIGYEDSINEKDEVRVYCGPTTDYSITGADILAARAALAEKEK